MESSGRHCRPFGAYDDLILHGNSKKKSPSASKTQQLEFNRCADRRPDRREGRHGGSAGGSRGYRHVLSCQGLPRSGRQVNFTLQNSRRDTLHNCTEPDLSSPLLTQSASYLLSNLRHRAARYMPVMKRPLVDYESGSGSESECGSSSDKSESSSTNIPPQLKRRRNGDVGTRAPPSAPAPAPAPTPIFPLDRSSGTHTIPPKPAPKSTSSLPPISDRFNDLYASNTRTAVSDDPSLHQGRRRQVPHIPGNWPSHVYIDWDPSSADRELLSSLVEKLQAEVAAAAQRYPDLEGVKISTALRDPELPVDKPLHISLSAPLTLTSKNKDDFLDDVTRALRSSGVSPFVVDFSGGVNWYRSEESTRSFLVLRVREVQNTGTTADSSPNPRLTIITQRCNKTAKEYGQPPLYDSQDMGYRFHVTIAWTHARPSESLKQLTDSIFDDCKTMYSENMSIRDKLRTGSSFRVETVKVKIGNHVTRFELPDKGLAFPVKTA
ncbi:hypothetical protein B0T13DRAFT_397925 [Neurospora crassa]|nr:hypothetical protein B0T13DRAFT_397925 [Neurospora crassa]